MIAFFEYFKFTKRILLLSIFTGNRRKVYVGEKLADGGFSVVFEACDYNDSQNKPCYALKRVMCGDDETVQKCRDEARVHET